MRTHVFGVIGLLALAISLVACGGGGGSGGSGSNNPPSVAPPPPPEPEPEPAPPQATVTVLHDFNDWEGGIQPNGPLIQASDGNFYGTTRGGGLSSCGEWPTFCGVIFEMAPDGTTSVLHQFGSIPNDGYVPEGRLLQGDDSALYGVTSGGGEFGGGTVFKVTLEGEYTLLHSFGATPDDGLVPVGGLIQGNDGNFYGVTASGGANHCIQIPLDGGNCGTVFRTTPSGETTILHSFGSTPDDGALPLVPLLQASDGNFYGTTQIGGANACEFDTANDCGAVFRMTPNGEMTILYSFGPTYHEPIAPNSNLIEGPDGMLYGTTASGGGGVECWWPKGCGTVFKMTLAGELTILYAFAVDSQDEGSAPLELILASDGNFYGTTPGGTGGDGTIFQLTPDGVLTTLHRFGPADEAPTNPIGGLIEANDGSFYGVTTYSKSIFDGAGSVYKLEMP